MSTDLVGSSGVVINLTNRNDAHSARRSDVLTVDETVAWTYAAAPGANQINELWHDSRTTDNTGQTFTLKTGTASKPDDDTTMVDAFGTTITFTAIKLMYIKNTDADYTLEIGGIANTIELLDGDADAILLPPGACFFYSNPSAAGLDVSGATNHLLQVKCTTDNDCDYDIVIGGET